MDLKYVGGGGGVVGWIYLAEDRKKRSDFVNKFVYFRFQ
jgi:hypothetical protein